MGEKETWSGSYIVERGGMDMQSGSEEQANTWSLLMSWGHAALDAILI